MNEMTPLVQHIEPFVLYEAKFKSLYLELDSGVKLSMDFALKNGRSSYLIFEHLVCLLSGLEENSQGGDADLMDSIGLRYEVKAFKDLETHPAQKHDLFHTGASSTFAANNIGQNLINPALKRGKANPENFEIEYQIALDACKVAGYAHNDFYVYTNTSQYQMGTPFRYVIFPTSTVLENLDKQDPRLISRSTLFSLITKKKALEF